MAITDLTNTTWYVRAGWKAEAEYGVFSVDYEISETDMTGTGFLIGYGSYVPTPDQIDMRPYPTEDAIIGYFYDGVYLTSSDSFALKIHGGTDVANPLLISWLETNGIQLKVTDLTDTTWYIPAGWEAVAGYGEFDVTWDDMSNSLAFPPMRNLNIGYGASSNYLGSATADRIAWKNDDSYYDELYNNTELYIYITGGTDVTNIRLIAWISQYGELQVEKTYTLSGVWEFNNVIAFPSVTAPTYEEQIYYFQNVNFVSSGETYSSFRLGTTNGTRWTQLLYDTRQAYLGGWDDWEGKIRTVDFGITEQEVSQEFYEWFTANATQQSEEEYPPEEETPEEVTDLTNTTWNIPAGWKADAGYGQFLINYSINYGFGEREDSNFNIGYQWGGTSAPAFIEIDDAVCGSLYGAGTMYDLHSFTIHIIDGVDVTNTSLIAWLTQYGELQTDEEEQPQEEPIATITYNGSIIAILSAGQKATLKCKGENEQMLVKMVDDIVVETAEVTQGGGIDSAIPMEVPTGTEMSALLSTAEVGSVYKYTGETTDTYENGALYVVEEESGFTVSVTSTNHSIYVHDTPLTDYQGTGALGEVTSGGTADFKTTTGKLYIQEPGGYNLKSHSETGGVTFDSFNTDYYGYVSEYTITGDGTISVTYGVWDEY